MYIKHKSTIFKTKTDDFGRIKAGLNDSIKDAIFNGNFFKRQNLLSNSDITAIKAYNAEIDKCTTSQTAFYRTMQNTSKEAQNVVTAANGNKVVLDGLTKSSKAAELGMKALSMAGNMLLMWGISEAITIIYDLATASDRLQKSAAQLGSEFANTKSDIDGYKTKIEELYQTINDDTSSYEDTYNARQELLKIQDEMIDKFGDEAKAVDLVTDAINGQTNALDTLTQNEWVETVNAFNSDRDKKWTEKFADFFANIGHKGNNFQRMIDEMENTEVTFHIMPMYGDETYEEFSKKLKKDFGASLTQYERDDAFTLSGDLDDIYKQLLNIQNLAKDMDIDDTFLKDLGDQADEAKGKLEDYQEIYSQHVLYDMIFNSDDYEKSFDEINKAYEKYQDAFASGDEKAIEEAKQNYAEIVQGAIEGLDDQSVIDYFNNMYPDLQEIVGGWEFEVKFKAAVDNDKDDFENEVKDAVSQFNTAEDIKNYNPKVATEEQKDAYLQLEQYADDYGLTLDQLIDKLVQLGLLQSQAKSDLLNKLIPSKSTPTAGFASALTDAMDSVDADEATKWIESLTEEEAKLANSKDFENALEEQKKKLNCASLSADDYAVALQTVKDKQNENSNETSTSFEIPDADTLEQQISDLNSAIDSIQSAYDTLNSAVEEYNSNGGQLSIDTIQSLLSLSDEYLACLQVENGQLSLNADAMAQLAQAKLDEAQATAVTQAMTELQAIANGEAAQSTANYITGNAALMDSLAQLSGSYEGVAQAAMTAAQAQELSARISAASAKDKTATENVMKGLDTKLKLIQSTKNAISAGNFTSVSKKSSSGSSSKSSKDELKEAFEAEYNLLKHNLEMETITEKEYYDGVQALNEKYFAGKEEYLDEYRKYEEEVYKGLKSYYKSYCDDMMDYWDKALAANKMSLKQFVNDAKALFDKLHNAGNLSDEDYWNYMSDYYQKQIDYMDKVVSAVDKVIDDEIDKLEDQKSKVESYYQNQIDLLNKQKEALEKANEARQKAIDLQKKQYELERAKNQRSDLMYKDNQFVYVANDQNIRDKQSDLDDAQYQMKIQEIENQISSLEDKMDELTGNIDKQIDDLNAYKDQWDSVAEQFGYAQDQIIASEVLGQGYEEEILAMRQDILDNFTNSYIDLQQNQVNAAWAAANSIVESINAQITALNALKEAQGIAGSSPLASIGGSAVNVRDSAGVSENSSNEKNNKSQKNGDYWTYKNLGSFNTSGEASSQIGMLGGDSVISVGGRYAVVKWIRGYKTAKIAHQRMSSENASGFYRRYASGTDNAEKGWHIVSEDNIGDEIVIDNNGNAVIPHGEQLYNFQGGEQVIPADESKEIIENQGNVEKIPTKVVLGDGTVLTPVSHVMEISDSIRQSMMKNVALPNNIGQRNYENLMKNANNISNVNNNQPTDNSVSIGEIHLHEVQNVDELTKGIIHKFPGKMRQALYSR